MSIKAETPELLDFLRTILCGDSEAGRFFWAVDRGKFKAGDLAGNAARYPHITVRTPYGKICLALHRVMWAFVTNAWPKKEIDHKDRNPANYAFINLREATSSQNKANRLVRKLNECGLKGVRLHKKSGLWNARVGAEGKSLGYFKTAEMAYAAYLVAARERYGEFSGAEE